jgi:hypothetical protein
LLAPCRPLSGHFPASFVLDQGLRRWPPRPCASASRSGEDGRPMAASRSETEPMMHALRDFFTTDYGLLSAAAIGFTLFMGVYFTRYAARHIREDGERAAREAAGR